MKRKIIVVDYEEHFLDSVRRGLTLSGFSDIRLESDPLNAAALIATGEQFDIALLDITMPGMDGLELLQTIRRTSPNTECIMVTAVNEARMAVNCLKLGAYDYLLKPITREDLVFALNRALERKRFLEILELSKKNAQELDQPQAFKPIITGLPAMRRILKEAELHAGSDVPVLITGESGTGKELLARAIHQASRRSGKTFAAINMASLTGTLFDAEFFGHTKGAFTGAEKERSGYLEHAHRGTIFLDEIGNLPLELQGKLLRVFQEGEYLKLGSNIPQKIDIRFIAATNADLDTLMAKGQFRKDLYYRIKGAWIHLPPLRERREDLALLITEFLRDFSKGSNGPALEEEAFTLLLDYDYPGNIRELRSILQSALNMARDKPISIDCLPEYLKKKKPSKARTDHRVATETPTTLAEVEKNHILNIYRQNANNKAQTAKILDVGINTLRRKLQEYGME